MKIEVTWDDIDNAIPDDPQECAIARAITRQAGLTVAVEEGYVFDCNSNTAIMETTSEMDEFVEAYDKELPVVPFSFELPISPPSTVIILRNESIEKEFSGV
jgi:hypothetical protein